MAGGCGHIMFSFVSFTNPLICSYGLRLYMLTMDTIFVVTCIQLYDATGGKMKALLIHPCESNVTSWMAGEFIDYGKIAVWAKEDGRCFVYRLSPRYLLLCVCMRVHDVSTTPGNHSWLGPSS